MKNSITAFILVILLGLSPLTAIASNFDSPGFDTVPFDGGDGPFFPGGSSGTNITLGDGTGAGAGAVPNCGGAAGGGALSNGLSSILGNSTVQRLLQQYGNLNVPGLGNINIGSLLQGGGLNIGSLLNGLNIPGIGSLGSLLGGGGISGLIGSIPGLSSIPGLGALTGLAGIGGGGPPVPIELFTAHQQTIEDIGSTRRSTNTLEKKECQDDIQVASQRNQKMTEQVRAIHEDIETGENGRSRYSKNEPNTLLKAQDSAAKTYQEIARQSLVNNVSARKVNELLVRDYESSRSPGAQLAEMERLTKPRNQGYSSYWAGFADRLSGGNTLHSSFVLYSGGQAQYTQVGVETVKRAIDQGDGFKPSVTGTTPGSTEGGVTGGTGAGGGTSSDCASIEDCPTTHNVSIPGSQIKEAAATASRAGFEQRQQADEPGEDPDDSFGNLLEQLLSNIDGFLGLLTRDSESGESYLDTMTGNANETTVATSRTILTQELTNSIGIEEERIVILTTMAADLAVTEASFEAVKQCYQRLVTSPSSTITSTLASERVNFASTTINVILAPQRGARTAEVGVAETVIDQLAELLVQVEAARTAESVNQVSDSYAALVASGAHFTEPDLVFLENDLQLTKSALTSAREQAGTLLAACQ